MMILSIDDRRMIVHFFYFIFQRRGCQNSPTIHSHKYAPIFILISQILSVKLSLHDNFGSLVLGENAPRSKRKKKRTQTTKCIAQADQVITLRFLNQLIYNMKKRPRRVIAHTQADPSIHIPHCHLRRCHSISMCKV